jgi:2Fe-2S iron-sulfur cluster binding domain
MPLTDVDPPATTPAAGVPDGGGFAGYGEPSTTTTLVVDGTSYRITCDPTMAALKAIREIAEHVRPRRGCQEGICGKCESIVDGAERRLCITPIGTLEGATIVTPAPRRSIWG